MNDTLTERSHCFWPKSVGVDARRALAEALGGALERVGMDGDHAAAFHALSGAEEAADEAADEAEADEAAAGGAHGGGGKGAGPAHWRGVRATVRRLAAGGRPCSELVDAAVTPPRSPRAPLAVAFRARSRPLSSPPPRSWPPPGGQEPPPAGEAGGPASSGEVEGGSGGEKARVFQEGGAPPSIAAQEVEACVLNSLAYLAAQPEVFALEVAPRFSSRWSPGGGSWFGDNALITSLSVYF